MPLPRRVLVLCALVMAAACGGDSTRPTHAINGRWSGPFSLSDVTGTMNLTLTQNGEHVTGTGSLVAAVSLTTIVEGTFRPPTFSLVITPLDYEPINYVGTAAASSMKGAMNGSGFDNISATVTRK